MSQPALALSAVAKRYTKYDDRPALLTSAGQLLRRGRRSELWALQDVDLAAQPGECLGVIGRNGSGKSTLLQLLCGVTAPTRGRVVVRGRIAPLISVGVGFHPELTGRENVYINATILGLTRAEIDRCFDEIVDFAGIEAFLDTPVKFYSSGMYVRLGFAVAIQVEPDVLLVDEVLAVGDLGFQMKCFDRMREIRSRGATVAFVTHNLTLVRNLCDRAVVLDAGRVVCDAAPNEAIDRYHRVLEESREPEGSDLGWARHLGGVATLTLDAVTGARGATTTLVNDSSAQVRVTMRALADVGAPYLGLVVHAADGALVYSDSNYGRPFAPLRAGDVRTLTVTFRPRLPTGSYTLLVTLNNRASDGRPTQLAVTPGSIVHVQGRPLVQGLADLEASFGGDPDGAG